MQKRKTNYVFFHHKDNHKIERERKSNNNKIRGKNKEKEEKK